MSPSPVHATDNIAVKSVQTYAYNNNNNSWESLGLNTNIYSNDWQGNFSWTTSNASHTAGTHDIAANVYDDFDNFYQCKTPYTLTSVPQPPSSAVCGTFDSNPISPTFMHTPVTWTFAGGSYLAVKYGQFNQMTQGTDVSDATKTYNPAISPQQTIGNIPDNPGGRTTCAKVSADGITYSAEYCQSCPLPTNPSPATISGPLYQKSGTGCTQASSNNNYFQFTNPNFTFTANPGPPCVTTTCGVNNNSQAYTYSCTTQFRSNNCLPTSWPSSTTLSLTGANSPGYTFVGWTNSSCSLPNNTQTVYGGITGIQAPTNNTNQPLTLSLTNPNWIKLRNASYNDVDIGAVTIPAVMNLYDSDDLAQKSFIVSTAPNGNEGGTVLKLNVNSSINTPYSTPHDWADISHNYSPAINLHPLQFESYVKARKSYQSISNLSQITADGIYVWTGGNKTIDGTEFGSHNVVLIADGLSTVITISNSSGHFAPTGSVAIIAHEIDFDDTVPLQDATGLFIADTVNTGSTNNQGLKINGNLIAQTSLTNSRQWSDTSRPSVFIYFQPNLYLNLLPYLSIAKYDYKELQ